MNREPRGEQGRLGSTLRHPRRLSSNPRKSSTISHISAEITAVGVHVYTSCGKTRLLEGLVRATTFSRAICAAKSTRLSAVEVAFHPVNDRSRSLYNHVMVRAAIIVASWLCFITVAAAQQSANPSKHMTIVLPPGVASETAHITYALEGSFGSHGDYVQATPNVTSYEMPLSVEGQLAGRVLIVAWIAGCQTRTFDMKATALRNRRVNLDCTPLPPVTLSGRIQPFAPIAGKPAELVVWYEASWECNFLGWMDCMVPQYQVETAAPGDEGTFQIQLPDFASDPVTNSFKTPPGMVGDFRFVVRDPKTWNPTAVLEPELADFRGFGGTVKALSSYPADLVFTPNFNSR